MKKHTIILLLLVSTQGYAQSKLDAFLTPSVNYNAGRANAVYASEGILIAVTLFGLDYLWYKNYERSHFHFYNDNHEWLQMDKIGHATTAYTIGVLGTSLYRWTGMSQRQATWWGGTEGVAYLTVIEMLDGFSAKWGFSKGDMLANLSGAALCMGQQFLWNQQRIQLKFTYRPSIYAQYRPDELGTTWIEKILKDYNGQTYWLSCNVSYFMKPGNNFPQWLNASAGYGAGGMLGGDSNPTEEKGAKLPTFERYRRVMLSADVDLERIDSHSPVLNTALYSINLFKVPAPVLELRLKEKPSIHLRFY